jgi:hypothetical protein
MDDTQISADTILIIHAVYVSIVVFSVPLIIVGGFRQWKWVHNFWFRISHLLMILIVVAESLLGINCPLTIWEYSFRPHTDQMINNNSDFIAGWLDVILFWNFSHWVFTAIYLCFGLLVLSLLFLVPIKHDKRKSASIR